MNSSLTKNPGMRGMLLASLVVCASSSTFAAGPAASAPQAAPSPGQGVLPGMPPVIDARNLYSEIGADRLSPLVRDDLVRIYVPNLRSNDVSVPRSTPCTPTS